MTTTPGSAAASAAKSATVGDYRLLARIGEGGMGIVHLARHHGSGARVALKVLRPQVIGDAEARRRLAQEVAALDRVRSPRIAGVLDADPYGETPYVVTRYIPGLPLNRYVEDEGVLDGAGLLHFAACLAEALAAVHAVGVLHRDVKPSNVLMEGRSPVLIDFGLARAAEDPTLTATGFMLGTPGYLPPEVLYGDPATPAGDIYSWAATVAFAALGRPPFGRGHPMAIMDRVRRGEHDLTGIAGPLVGLLRRCLAVEPLDRPTASEVLECLRAWQPGAEASAADDRTELWTRPVSALDPMPSREAATVPAAAADDATAADQPLTALLTSDVFAEPPPARTRGESALRAVARAALGAVVVGAVAFAPYVVLALVSALVLVLRTASVTRQRHLRRRNLRGRARWYDVPATTISLPGYLVLGAGGAVLLVLFAGFVALGATALATLAGWSVSRSVVTGAVVLVPCLWWGPGSSRVREMVAPLVDRCARNPRAVTGLVVLGAVLTLGLLAAVGVQGPNWYPALQAPWK